MSFFLNKIESVKKMFFNQDKQEPEKNVKKTPNTIKIKEEYDLEKSDITKNDDILIDDQDNSNDEVLPTIHYDNYYNVDKNEENTEDFYDDTPYEYKNTYSNEITYYHYINDRLNRTFGSCMDYDSMKYKIHFCIFAINDTCEINGYKLPFLKFVFENKDNLFVFPTIEFNCPHKQTIDKKPIEVDDDIYFKNECIKKLLDVFEIDKIDEPMMEKIYKGFLEFDENNIFVVFDFTYIKSIVFKTEESKSFLFFSTKVEKYEWGIIDEIRKKEIQKIPIENLVLDFFQKYRYMNEIKTDNRSLLSIPSSLYLCKYENNSYKNITETFNTNYEKRSMHPHLGFFYFFSVEQLQKDAKRYAIFSENNIVLDRTFEKMKEDNINEYNNILLKYSVFEYVENNETIWCVKPDNLFCEL